MIDYHCHLLPGLDDGPAAVAESLAMARALVKFGFREVHCTPHCIAGQYEISPVEVREAVRKLQARLDLEGIALVLHTGMEYYLDDCFERFAANLLPLGESRLVLCEAPSLSPPELVGEMASLIVVQGYLPLIAHPERCDVIWQMLNEAKGEGGTGDEEGTARELEVQETGRGKWWRRLFSRSSPSPSPSAANNSALSTQHSALVSSLLPEETMFQANLGSFVGYYGPQPQRRAYELLQRGVYHCIASDLHDARSATALLDQVKDKLAFNPALRKLCDFRAPQGPGGNEQMAFW